MSDIPPSDTEQDSDYDGAWKEALRLYLQQFLAKYFPAEHAAIDWTVAPEWLDKELSQVLAQAGERNRVVDVLVKVRLRDGRDQWILLHLEIQTSYEADFAWRIAQYNAGLIWSFRQRVLTLVVLADLRKSWRPEEDVFRVGTFESRLKYPVCKLLDRLENEWRDDYSMPVLLARAQVEALRTAGDPEGRYRAKWTLVRGLYDLGYNKQEVRQIFRLIDWMMHLSADLEKQFTTELTEFEEKRQMPYVTSVERVLREQAEAIGEARGEARGEVSGKMDLVLAQLIELLGDLLDEHRERIRNLSSEQVHQLGKDLIRFHSSADLHGWLDQHAPVKS